MPSDSIFRFSTRKTPLGVSDSRSFGPPLARRSAASANSSLANPASGSASMHHDRARRNPLRSPARPLRRYGRSSPQAHQEPAGKPGYATDKQENELEGRCVGTAIEGVADSGFALSISGPVFHMDLRRLRSLVRVLRQHAQRTADGFPACSDAQTLWDLDR